MSERGRDSFATFLNTIEQLEQSKQEVSETTPAQQITADRHVKALINLLHQGGAQPVPQLLRASEMAYREFVSTVDLMEKINVIIIEGSPGKEVVKLTPLGEQMTHLEV